MACTTDFDLVFSKGNLQDRYLTHCCWFFPCYTPWKNQKTVGSNRLTEHHCSCFFIFLKWVDSLSNWQGFDFLKLRTYWTQALHKGTMKLLLFIPSYLVFFCPSVCVKCFPRNLLDYCAFYIRCILRTQSAIKRFHSRCWTGF